MSWPSRAVTGREHSRQFAVTGDAGRGEEGFGILIDLRDDAFQIVVMGAFRPQNLLHRGQRFAGGFDERPGVLPAFLGFGAFAPHEFGEQGDARQPRTKVVKRAKGAARASHRSRRVAVSPTFALSSARTT